MSTKKYTKKEHKKDPKKAPLGRSPFRRYVQIGRVALINYGPDEGKLATVAEVIDHNRVLIDGPTTGVQRQQLPIRRLSLTDIVVNIAHGARQKKIKKQWAKEGVLDKWNKTAWAKKRATRAARENLSDFERFKVMVARKRTSFAVHCHNTKLVKSFNKSNHGKKAGIRK